MEAVTIPPTYELQKPNAWFYVQVPEGEALHEVSSFFGKRGLLAHYIRGDDALRLTTLPSEEVSDNKHFRRITYQVKISLFGTSPKCTWIEVRWYLEGRGIFDPDWKQILDPQNFSPLLLGPLTDMLDGRRCRLP